MKFELRVKHEGETDADAWIEKYDYVEIETQKEAELQGTLWIDSFNQTLKPNELPRVLISATITGESEPDPVIEDEEDNWDNDDEDDEEDY